MPHFALECLKEIDQNYISIWPKADLKLVEKKKLNIVIQIGGKKRGLLESEPNITKEKLIEKIKKDNVINKFINGKKIKKSIYIKDKLINLITE